MQLASKLVVTKKHAANFPNSKRLSPSPNGIVVAQNCLITGSHGKRTKQRQTSCNTYSTAGTGWDASRSAAWSVCSFQWFRADFQFFFSTLLTLFNVIPFVSCGLDWWELNRSKTIFRKLLALRINNHNIYRPNDAEDTWPISGPNLQIMWPSSARSPSLANVRCQSFWEDFNEETISSSHYAAIIPGRWFWA